MGARGPKPQPTAIKILRGNPGKRALNRDEPKPEVKAPACPAWLDAEAKAEWKRRMPELVRLGVIAEIDGALFAAYCESWSAYLRCVKVLQEKGETYRRNGIARDRPEVKRKITQLQMVEKLASHFGITPATRSRIKVEKPKEEKNQFTEFLKHG